LAAFFFPAGFALAFFFDAAFFVEALPAPFLADFFLAAFFAVFSPPS
jgi:hypothetical protein